MHPLPHRYVVTASVAPDSEIALDSPAVPRLLSDAPLEFDGPGTRWSPETLLTAAVAGCLSLTFRGVARARRLPFVEFRCEVAGTLDRVEGRTLFTAFHVRASVYIPPEVSADDARQVLIRAKDTCLVTHSLTAETTFETEVHTAAPALSGSRSTGRSSA